MAYSIFCEADVFSCLALILTVECFPSLLIMVRTFHQTIGVNVCWRLLLIAIRKLSFLNLRPNKWLPLLWNYLLPYNWALINICWIFLCKEKMFVCNIFRFLKLVNSQTSGFAGFLGVTCHSHKIWDFFIFLCLSWMYKLSHKFRTTQDLRKWENFWKIWNFSLDMA